MRLRPGQGLGSDSFPSARLLALLVVALAHLGLWIATSFVSPPRLPAVIDAAQSAFVWVLPAPMLAPLPAPAQRENRPSITRRPTQEPRKNGATQSAPSIEVAPQVETTESNAIHLPPMSTETPVVFPEPKSRSSELNLKLDRATLRDLARGAGGHPANDSKRQQPRLTAQEKMGQDIAKSARGNCMKGEYPGGGMGLLSLPFLIAAELRERCAD